MSVPWDLRKPVTGAWSDRGGGKVSINPDYILSRDADRIVIRNYEGQVFEYPEANDGTPLAAPPAEIREPELV